MRKTKVIYALIASAMLSLAVTGCGSNETIDNDMSVESTTPVPTDAVDLGGVVDSDDVTPTTEPTATSTPVPTETPTPEPTATSTPVPTETPTLEPTATSTPVPTATPTPEPTEAPVVEPTEAPTPEPTEAPVVEEVKADWFAENGYTINGQGAYSYSGLVEHAYLDGTIILENSIMNGEFAMKEVDNGDGTKKVTVAFSEACRVFDDGAWSGRYGFSFIADRETGAVFVNAYLDGYEKFSFTLEDGTVIDGKIAKMKTKPTNGTENLVEYLVAVVPADYDNLVFGFAPVQGFDKKGQVSTISDLEQFFVFDTCEFIFFAD